LVGEAVRSRSLLFYTGLSGFCAAAVPTLARALIGSTALEDSRAMALEKHLTLLFFFTGVVSGGVYWLLAGRTAIRRRNDMA
jgi:hypothetical protein